MATEAITVDEIESARAGGARLIDVREANEFVGAQSGWPIDTGAL